MNDVVYLMSLLEAIPDDITIVVDTPCGGHYAGKRLKLINRLLDAYNYGEEVDDPYQLMVLWVIPANDDLFIKC